MLSGQGRLSAVLQESHQSASDQAEVNTPISPTANGQNCALREISDCRPHSPHPADAITWLCQRGANINALKDDGWHDTALHYAASKGCLASVQALLAFGADPNARNFAGERVKTTHLPQLRRLLLQLLLTPPPLLHQFQLLSTAFEATGTWVQHTSVHDDKQLVKRCSHPGSFV